MAANVTKRFILDGYILEPELRLLIHNGQAVHLPHRPFQVLLYLIEHRDRLVGRAELLDLFWEGHDVYDATLTKCVGRIRKALSDQLDQPRFIETRYAEGYRFIGPLEEQVVNGEPAIIEIERTRGLKIIVEEEEIQEPGQASELTQSVQTLAAPLRNASKTSHRITAASLALIATVVTLSALIAYRSRAESTATVAASAPASLVVNSIAVLPLKNLSADPGQEYISDGLTENFITELSKIKSLKVISRSSVFTFKGKETDPREIGRKLGVAVVLEGSVRRSGDRVRVDVRLVSTDDGRVLWVGKTYDRSLSDIFTTEDEISCSVASELRVKLCGGPEALKHDTNNVDAYQAYLKGRYFINNQYSLGMADPEQNLTKAADYFEQAIQIDRNYAAAYGGLSDAYAQVVWFLRDDPRPVIAKAKAAALKAIELDSSMAETHTALASAYLLEWDFQASAREHKRAIALNPDYADAHHQYSAYFMTVGRVDDMLAEMKRAEELDPLNLYIVADVGVALYMARRNDEAIAQFHKWHDIAQRDGAGSNIAMCYLQKGMFAEAIKELQKAKEVDTAKGRMPANVAWLAVSYAMDGQKNEARHLLAEMKEISKMQYVPKSFFAYVYAALGQKEQAFELLDGAYRDHDSTLIGLKTHPWFDPLRTDPRFAKLLMRIGLPE